MEIKIEKSFYERMTNNSDMMIIFWIIGIALIVWIVRELTNKKIPTETKPTPPDDRKDKKNSTCCH